MFEIETPTRRYAEVVIGLEVARASALGGDLFGLEEIRAKVDLLRSLGVEEARAQVMVSVGRAELR